MEQNEIQTVQMTAEERAKYEAFKRAEALKERLRAKREARKAYAALVDETIEAAMPQLAMISSQIAAAKSAVQAEFNRALELKAEIFDDKAQPRTHTFTNSAGDKRIILGRYAVDAYRDTVEDGIAKVRGYIQSLAKDAESAALVKAILRLMSKDQNGTLKASRVLQLRKMAEDSGNEDFMEGVKIIEEAYQPIESKQFIRAETRNPETGAWQSIPLGMTEA